MSCDFKGLIDQILTPLVTDSIWERVLGPKQGPILGTYQWGLECAQDGNKSFQESKQNESGVGYRKSETFAHGESFRKITDTRLSPRVGSGLWFAPNKTGSGLKYSGQAF
jgi:hypothetical protein